jgi:hypothetical protein
VLESNFADYMERMLALFVNSACLMANVDYLAAVQELRELHGAAGTLGLDVTSEV